MKKSSFTALILGLISGVMFALGMCMALLTEWNAFKEGIILGSAGIVLALVTVFVWRKMENKPKIKFTAKGVLTTVVSIVGALTLGVGMCFVLVWNKILVGTLIGLGGIVIMLCLIPLTVGVKK